MKTTKEILVEARALISNEENWTQGTFARENKASTFGLDEQDPRASCFCSHGALSRSAGLYVLCNEPSYLALRNAMDGSIHIFNDNHTHAEVLAAFDAAINSLN